jgi:xanthine/uracil permease
VSNWIHAYKPAASRRTHLLLASLLWSGVGTLLLFFGVWWMFRGHNRSAPWLTVAALGVGVVKARFVLARAAGRIINRILTRDDGRCVGGFLSIRTWLLVVVMASAGRWLRSGPIPHVVVGFVYAAVGTALLLASRPIWRAWHREQVGG